ncbi:MAG: hypothetical protein NTW94_04685 [Legionellales bacterium]|nr:hypothetical protein [Legionellales bacterium]
MKKLMIAVFSLLVSACTAQYTTNGEQKYQTSRNGVQLVVPPPLTSENISHFYDLPPQNQDPAVSVRPPVLQSSKVERKTE